MALLRSLTVDNDAVSHVILCGDTNFSLRKEKEALGPKLGDCWKDLFLADKVNDIYTNSLLLKG